MSEPVALLLTDIVDSTRITEAVGDAAMTAHWAMHDRIARELLRKWKGWEVERTDGLLAVFASAEHAAKFALAYHRALADQQLPFKARASLHVGQLMLQESDAADMAVGARRVTTSGMALHIVARVNALAAGGQTLVTAEAQRALADEVWHLQSLGFWRLKGAQEPVELYGFGDRDEPLLPPPDGEKAYRVVRHGDIWLPARELRHSLPAERDAFVGRGDALVDLARQLERGSRIVSVLGIGGAGKTRLVTHFAWAWLGEFPGGIWFCDLAQARSIDGITFAMAQGLDVPLGKSDPVAQLAFAIAGRGRCLVILDNFEQVARYAEDTLGHWLDRAPEAQFLVTTREVLGIVGEVALALAPMSAQDSASLFLERAHSARSDFRPGPDDLSAVAELAKALDGLPLAIELAAAQTRTKSPRTLLLHMAERFKVLKSRGGRRGRQATLRAAFDWSWELLNETEKSALAQLSIFEGGFSSKSAAAVLDLSLSEESPWAGEAVESLADKSFIRRVADDRFDLFESVRVYASEHLRTEQRFPGSGAAAQAAAEYRHGRFFAQLGETPAVAHRGAELENLIAACRRAVRRNDAETACQALAGAWRVLNLRGPFRVGIELSTLVKSMNALPPELDAAVRRISAGALMQGGRMVEARAEFEHAEAAVGMATDRGLRPRIQAGLAELSMREGRAAEAAEHYRRALAGSPAVADPVFECDVLSGLGTCQQYLGQLDLAEDYYAKALAIARDRGERRWEGGALGNLGQLSANRGRLPEAQQSYEAALAIAQELDDRQWEGNVRCNLGLLHHGEGRMPEARHHLDAALAIARELGHAQLECVVLCNLGIVFEAVGDRDGARARYKEAISLARKLGDRRSEGQFLGYLGLLHALQGEFPEAEACLARGAELLAAVSDRVSLGVLLCASAEAKWLAGDLPRARAVLSGADRIVAEVGAEPKSELGIASARAKRRFNGG